MENVTIQQKLFRIFCERPLGRLSSETLLGQMALIMRSKRYGFEGLILRDAADLLNLSDEQCECALRLLPSLDMPMNPEESLRLVAGSAR
ncbi:hypothetical protein KKD88_02665 [Patescibacteria group bacterium]|nr:hypothetical protein [Patescibacteria group bacterium]